MEKENKKEKSYQQYKIYIDKTLAGGHIKIQSLLGKIWASTTQDLFAQYFPEHYLQWKLK